MHASVAYSPARRAITVGFAALFVVVGVSAERAGAGEADGKKRSGSELLRNIQRIGNDVGREISKAASAGAEAVNKAKKANSKAGK